MCIGRGTVQQRAWRGKKIYDAMKHQMYPQHVILLGQRNPNFVWICHDSRLNIPEFTYYNRE